MYMGLKHLHMTVVAISVTLFVLRFVWLMLGSSMLDKKWVKVVPHVVDTVLLASAIGLCVVLNQYPLQMSWLTAKVVGVLCYILCGLWVLKWAKASVQRIFGFVLALTCLATTAHVAMTKNPLLFG